MRWEAVAPSRTHPLRPHPCTCHASRSLTALRAALPPHREQALAHVSGLGFGKPARSRHKAAARLDLDVCVGLVNLSRPVGWRRSAALHPALLETESWPVALPSRCAPADLLPVPTRPSRPVCTASLCVVSTDAARRTHRSRSVRHPALAACSRGVSERNVWSVSGRAGSPQQIVRQSLRSLALPCTACLPSCLRCVAERSSAGINSPRVLATINEVRKWQLTRLGRVGLRRG